MSRKTKPRRAKGLPDLAQQKRQFLAHLNAGRPQQALAVVENLIAKGVRNANVYSDGAVALLRLEQWQAAMDYARKAIALDAHCLSAWDVLSHAAGANGDLETTASSGHKALTLRDSLVPSDPPFEAPLAPPLATGRAKIIAFSLFGSNSKYCEGAVLNAIEQPRLYPGWRCRFFVDHSVPAETIRRLRAHGADVIAVDEEAAQWPGPMWRFLAYDAPDAQRVIFRDTDSVISPREVGAVAEWQASGLPFHAMRDNGSHTELLLAGLWGVVRGALPVMRDMMRDYMQKPVTNHHFADQFFLRSHVWPYARTQILQHDSLFGFQNPQPFPQGPHRRDFHVGYAETSPVAQITTTLADGSHALWSIEKQTERGYVPVCSYLATVQGGAVRANVPARYVRGFATGRFRIRLRAADGLNS